MGDVSESEPWRLGHRPALDGLRGVAILIVLAGHSLIPGVRDGGRAGVALFFTLSGFLITALLLEEHGRSGAIHLRAFYVRRLRRLGPAQMFCVVLVSAFAVAQGTGLILTPWQSIASALYLRNFGDGTGILGHFWTLAVEEQFYLAWAPLLALLLARKIPRRRLILLVAGAAVCSPLARILWADVRFGEIRLAHTLPLTCDALLAGCALAVWMHGRREGRTRSGVAAVAVVVVLLTSAALSIADAEMWGASIVAVATVAVLWATAQGSGPRWLTGSVLRWFGTRSYSIYLWHFPFTYTAQMAGADSWHQVAPVWPMALLAAELSYRYVEQPFRVRREVVRPEIEPRSRPTSRAA